MIIFKFAIIDLGKSYCDKNELIIKFISEINSTAIKQLAGAAGAAGVRPSRRPSPRAKPGLAPLEAGAWVITIMSSRGPLFPLSQRERPVPGVAGQTCAEARGLTPRPDVPPGPMRSWLPSVEVGVPMQGRPSRGSGNKPQMWSQPGKRLLQAELTNVLEIKTRCTPTAGCF